MSKRGRDTRASFAAPPCPADPQHGPLLSWGNGHWHCPHSDHTVKGGDMKYMFTDEELMKGNDK